MITYGTWRLPSRDIPWKMDVSGSIKMMRDEGFVLVAGVVSM